MVYCNVKSAIQNLDETQNDAFELYNTQNKFYHSKYKMESQATLSAIANYFLRFLRHLLSVFCHCSKEPWLLSQISSATNFSLINHRGKES